MAVAMRFISGYFIVLHWPVCFCVIANLFCTMLMQLGLKPVVLTLYNSYFGLLGYLSSSTLISDCFSISVSDVVSVLLGVAANMSIAFII